VQSGLKESRTIKAKFDHTQVAVSVLIVGTEQGSTQMKVRTCPVLGPHISQCLLPRLRVSCKTSVAIRMLSDSDGLLYSLVTLRAPLTL
jgi:hypothetical protein